MSGHNKWSSIKYKKGAVDAKRGKLFSRLAKEITLSARDGGGDPDLNARLRTAIATAKTANMPNDNVDRAIRKGTGQLDGGALEELSYEGYAAGGVAVIATCLSDNRNRTAADVRNLFAKNNSALAGAGSVAWMFHRKARFVIEGDAADEEALLELLLEKEVDVEDLSVEDGTAEIVAPPEAFAAVADALEGAGIPIASSGLNMVPETTVELADAASARQVLRLVEALEDNDDVQEVYANFDMPDELMAQLAAE